ncbi:MAG: glycosyltransferase family 4 protein [Lacibacter sp.]
MKVLWLCSWYPNSADPFDGDFIERHARSLATQQRVDIIHILQNVDLLKWKSIKPEIRDEKNLHAEIFYLPFLGNKIKPVSQAVFNLSYYLHSRRIIKKYIAEKGRPDIVHVHVPVKAGYVALWLKKKWNIPVVVTEHNSGYYKHIPGNYFDRNFYFKSVTKQSFENAELVTSVSKWLLKRLEEIFQIRKSKVIRNAVDTTLFFPVNTTNRVKQFIHVSMMPPLKNVEGILKSLALLNHIDTNWSMQFIGPASEQYKALCTELGLGNQVEWKGALSYGEVAYYVQRADALVHFSHYENLPCVVNEALCCGIPVISSDVGGISELVNETNGLLVENNNSSALANALNNFLQKPDRYNKKEISSSATEMFSYSEIGKQMMDMYREIVNS